MEKKETNKIKREKVLDIKINKSALEKFMARLFWYTLIIITVGAIVLLIASIGELAQAWSAVSEALIGAWMMIKMPFITLLVCSGWLGFIALFVYLIRES